MAREKEVLRVTFDAANKLSRPYGSILEYVDCWLDRDAHAAAAEAQPTLQILPEWRPTLLGASCSGAGERLSVRLQALAPDTYFYGVLNGGRAEPFRLFSASTVAPVALPNVHRAHGFGAVVAVLMKDCTGLAVLLLDCRALKRAAAAAAAALPAEVALKIYYRAADGRCIEKFDLQLATQLTPVLRRQNLLHVESQDIRESLLFSAIRGQWRAHRTARLHIRPKTHASDFSNV